MRPTTDLFDLIRSMSDTERQLFVRSVNKKGADEAVLVRLFDAIARMPEYDEASLLASIDHEPLQRGFAAYKHYLYAMVVRFVAAQEADRPLPALLQTVQQVEALVDRGLYHQAWRHIKRAMPDAERIDAFDVLWRLLQQERNIVMIRQERHFSDEPMHDAVERIDGAIDSIEHRWQQVNALRTIQRKLTAGQQLSLDGEPIPLHQALADTFHTECPTIDALSSTTARMLWHHVHILFYGKVDRRPDVVHRHASELLTMLEGDASIASAFSMHLMRAAATFATASTWVGDMDGVRRAIDMLRHGPERFGFRRTAAMQTLTLQSYTYQAVLRDETLDFDNIDGFLHECLTALDRFAELGRRQFADELRTYVAKIALLTNRLPVVHKVAAEVLRHKSPSTPGARSLMRQIVCVASLLVDDADAVESIATTALRAAKTEPLNPALQSFFKTVLKYIEEPNRSTQQSILQQHLDRTRSIVAQQNHYDASADITAPHIIWATSVVQRQSMLDTYRAAMKMAMSANAPEQ
jgi:hypothetical protein